MPDPSGTRGRVCLAAVVLFIGCGPVHRPEWVHDWHGFPGPPSAEEFAVCDLGPGDLRVGLEALRRSLGVARDCARAGDMWASVRFSSDPLLFGYVSGTGVDGRDTSYEKIFPALVIECWRDPTTGEGGSSVASS